MSKKDEYVEAISKQIFEAALDEDKIKHMNAYRQSDFLTGIKYAVEKLLEREK